MSDWRTRKWIPLLRAVVIALGYFVLAKGALTLAALHPSASPVWPPSGLALASLLLWGNGLWPAIAVGAFLADATTFGSLLTSALIACGSTLEALITVSLLKRWTATTNPFETPLQVVLFAALALAPGTMLSATVGVSSLVLAGFAESTNFISMWFSWWLGDVGGQLLVTPVIVLWFRSGFRKVGRTELRRGAVLLAATVIVGLVAFSPLLIQQASIRRPLAFLTVAPLLWSALRHNQRDTATVALVLCAFAIWGTLFEQGQLPGPKLDEPFLWVLAFVISATVPSMVLSADVAMRRISEEHKKLLIAELDHRVKNLLACVAAVAQRSRETSKSADEFLHVLNIRINSLAKTHALLSLSRWQSIHLDELVRSELAFCANDSVVIEGPPVDLAAEAVQPVAMVLHELATNAAKYGALSNSHGRVLVRWRRQSNGGNLVLEWLESGGPQVASPAGTGYGTGVIQDIIPYELGGIADFVLAADGACCRLEIPGKWLSN